MKAFLHSIISANFAKEPLLAIFLTSRSIFLFLELL